MIRDALINLARRRFPERPEEAAIWLPTSVLVEVVRRVTGQALPPNRASRYVAALTVRGLRKSDRGSARGWEWRGDDTPPGTRSQDVSLWAGFGEGGGDSDLDP